jgi:hypothetical protein
VRALSKLALALLGASALACLHPGAGGRRMERIEQKVDRILAGQEATAAALEELLALARAQGTGELTLFFPWASSRLPVDQEERLVRFLDHLAHEAHGRKILLVSVGAASDWRTAEWNDPLSRRRAEAPRALVSQHLVHLPHAWHRVVAQGDRGAPPGAAGPTWRHVRILAVYDEGQLPPLPASPGG